MVKIILCAVNTKYIHSNPAVYILQAYALGNCLPVSGENLEVMEFSINNSPEEAEWAIYEKKPDAVFFSCYIWNLGYILDMSADLHKVLPETDIWLGGPEVSFESETLLERHSFLRGIITGEGEIPFMKLVQWYPLFKEGLSDFSDISHVQGICFRNGDEIVTNSPGPPVSMDEIPFIYNDENMELFDNKILYYESSRGCPFSCSYCLSSVDKKVRFRSLDKVFDELQFFLNHKVPQVKFVDRTFNADSRRTVLILAYLREHDNGITNFHFEIAGELLTEQELSIMEQLRPGLIQLEIGVQSVHPETLKYIHRKADLSKLWSVTERIRRMGNIHQHLDLIAGLPGEDYETFRISFNQVYSMKPSQLQLGFLKVLKGTPIRANAEEYGIIYKDKAPYEVLRTRWLSHGEIIKLKQVEEMVELYYNSRQFTKTLLVLEKEFPDPFTLYEELALFYKEKGYFVHTPSRIHRYQVLLEFILEHVPEKGVLKLHDGNPRPNFFSFREGLYGELLTFDLYFRENLKNRPCFAPAQDPYKDMLRNLRRDCNLRKDNTLHLEVFFFPVHKESAEEITDPQQMGLRVLAFDYNDRDPLDHNARVKEVHRSLI